MALIDIKDMAKLHTAEEVRAVASSAILEQKLMGIAHEINIAANTGEYRAQVTGPLSEDVLAALSAKGYTAQAIGTAKETDLYLISWKAE